MVVISSAELRNNMKKYLDLTTIEPVIIQRGKTETFVLSKHDHIPNIDLSRAITKSELVKRIKSDIREIHSKRKHEGIISV